VPNEAVAPRDLDGSRPEVSRTKQRVTPHLYDLGMSNTTTQDTEVQPRIVDRAVRRALLAELSVDLRQLHVAVLAETLANGLPVNPAALVVVLSAHDEMAEVALRFTSVHVEELLWCGVTEFCEDFGLVMPDGCPEALHAVLAVATRSSSLDVESDPVSALFAAFHQLTAS
jgi:hypothetical protein